MGYSWRLPSSAWSVSAKCQSNWENPHLLCKWESWGDLTVCSGPSHSGWSQKPDSRFPDWTALSTTSHLFWVAGISELNMSTTLRSWLEGDLSKHHWVTTFRIKKGIRCCRNKETEFLTSDSWQIKWKIHWNKLLTNMQAIGGRLVHRREQKEESVPQQAGHSLFLNLCA